MPDFSDDDAADIVADAEARLALSNELVEKHGWPEPLAKATADDAWSYTALAPHG